MFWCPRALRSVDRVPEPDPEHSQDAKSSPEDQNSNALDTSRVSHDVTNTKVVGKTVSFHLLGEDLGRSFQLVFCFELAGQMPLALVCCVVTAFAQQVPNGPDVRRQTLRPGEVCVVEHLSLLNMTAGVNHRARRGADARVDTMALEDNSILGQPLTGRQAKPLG